jgi:hypothetical protein
MKWHPQQHTYASVVLIVPGINGLVESTVVRFKGTHKHGAVNTYMS